MTTPLTAVIERELGRFGVNGEPLTPACFVPNVAAEITHAVLSFLAEQASDPEAVEGAAAAYVRKHWPWGLVLPTDRAAVTNALAAFVAHLGGGE